jgi:hypothetical protein
LESINTTWWQRREKERRPGAKEEKKKDDHEEQVDEMMLPATDEKWYGASLKAYKMEPTCEDVLLLITADATNANTSNSIIIKSIHHPWYCDSQEPRMGQTTKRLVMLASNGSHGRPVSHPETRISASGVVGELAFCSIRFKRIIIQRRRR